jgi:DNA-binding MarR family transcriptional regulator
MSETKRNCAAGEILRVIPKVMRTLASELRQAPGGLAPAHFQLMVMLSKRPRCLTELAQSQSVSLATMSNSISVLVDRGWVARRRDPTDRRKLALEITNRGREVLTEVHQRAEVQLDEMLAVMDEDQCEDILRGLELLNNVFSRNTEESTALRREAK